MKDATNHNSGLESGYSIIEVLAVLVVIGIMLAFTLIYAYPHQQLYKPDDESLLLTDVLQEARQRSLTQRESMRVEVSKTRGTASLYDENSPATADDDILLKRIALFPEGEVAISTRPSNLTYNPPEPLAPPNAVFQNSIYTPSIGQEVLTMRFMSNGTVVNAGNNSIGTGSVPTGVMLTIWSPAKVDPTEWEILRALTVIGTTGVVRLWEFNPTLPGTNKWQDSRRYGTYGTGTSGTPSPTP